MLLVRRIEISNFVCFDDIEITPSTNPDRPLTVVRAENGSGKTTLLRAIRWGMYGERGLPGNPGSFSLHPASWQPDAEGIETRVSILFETDGSSRHHLEGRPTTTEYELRRSVTTVRKKPTSKGDPDFQRIHEDAKLLERERDGSWAPHEHGVRSVIDQLLPWSLRDFFVMDTDEAADFVGGSENKEIQRHEVIGKTSYAVRALLGLEVFDEAKKRVASLQQTFERDATKATRNAELAGKQAELDQVRGRLAEIETRLERNRHERADTDERLAQARGRLESLIGSLAAHDQLQERLVDNERHTRKASEERRSAAGELSGDLTRIDLLASLASREVRDAEALLQPLYDDGSIPVRHLDFVRRLLETGTCVCGQDLSYPGMHTDHVQQAIDSSAGQQDRADYLAEVLHAATAFGRHRDGEEWEQRTDDHTQTVGLLDQELDNLALTRKDIDAQLDDIDEDEVQNVRGRIEMLEKSLGKVAREIVSDQETCEQLDKDSNKLEADIRAARRQEAHARDLERYEETADVVVQVLERAYASIEAEQVRELDAEMNALFERMAANVVDDEAVEDNRHKATLRMIARVGVRPVEDSAGEYEIFALNSRGRSMPPTEINGASRRILALSFVLALCKVSRTQAPLVADSLLNFMSGSVLTNTLRVTAETARQPMLLLTPSDLESPNEIEVVERYAGATYTLTGQWQHVDQGGDVVNQTDYRQVALLCGCGPRQFCGVCERRGQAEDPKWSRHQPREAQQ
ncbi:MAG: AAA family ATPase [Gammaproteobacteria bacterium]|nr:AAA family ATPase [Gammaproteobacteria bacterium]